MRKSWRALIVIALAGLWPQVGCHQLPADKSVQDLKPIQKKESAAKPLTAAESGDALVAQAKALEDARKPGEAVALYEKIRVSDPAQAVYATRRIAFLYLCNNELDRAEQEYYALLQRNSRDADTLFALGDIAYRRGHFGTAEKWFRDALVKQPDHAHALINLGLTLAHNGDYAGSIELFRKAGFCEGEAYCKVAFVLKVNGKREEAMTAYQHALTCDPRLEQARIEMAQMYRDDPGLAVRMTTPLKTNEKSKQESQMPPPLPVGATGVKGEVNMEAPPPLPISGIGRAMMQQPTLPPLDVDLPVPESIEWRATGKKK